MTSPACDGKSLPTAAVDGEEARLQFEKRRKEYLQKEQECRVRAKQFKDLESILDGLQILFERGVISERQYLQKKSEERIEVGIALT